MDCRNTRQKYVILKVIKDNRNHPTIAEICESVQKMDPSIGQATVYRNVKKFLEEGKISQLKTKKGVDRYDYYQNHIHFECLSCGQVLDIIDDKLSDSLPHFFPKNTDIKSYNLMLEGYCENCGENIN